MTKLSTLAQRTGLRIERSGLSFGYGPLGSHPLRFVARNGRAVLMVRPENLFDENGVAFEDNLD